MENFVLNETIEIHKIAVVGLGYVGLPLALTFVEKGFSVTGIDIDEGKIKKIRNGESYLNDLGDEAIRKATLSKRFSASTDFSLLDSVDAIIICVPTPITAYHHPDLSFLQEASFQVSKYLRKGQLIILESSTYPGTTSEVLVPTLEKSGLKVGTDIFVGYSPERIDPGNTKYAVEDIPKVVSGTTERCLDRVCRLYRKVFSKLVKVSSTETAELTKLVENCHRLINISFINELAIICDSLNMDIWEVIEAASTKPFGFTPYYPGPGIGGHCIPVDPLYLQWKAKLYGKESQFINLAMSVNKSVPKYVVSKIEEFLTRDGSMQEANILIYGITYKREINDVRESTVFQIIRSLKEKGAHVQYHDPYVPNVTADGEKMDSVALTEEALRKTDCVLIFTDHSCIPLQQILDNAPLVFDTRNVTNGMKGNAKVIVLGGGTV